MSEPLKPMTEEELAAKDDIPQVHKDAIEQSIRNWSLPDDPEDKEWPDYFRAAEVQCQLGCEIGEDDELEDGEYDTDCVWFAAGWKARGNTESSAAIFREMAEWLMGRYLVKTGDHYKIEREHTAQMRNGLPPWEKS